MRRLLVIAGLSALGMLTLLALAHYRSADMVLAFFAGQLPGCW